MHSTSDMLILVMWTVFIALTRDDVLQRPLGSAPAVKAVTTLTQAHVKIKAISAI